MTIAARKGFRSVTPRIVVVDAAAQTAIKQAGDQLCGDYMAAVQFPASRVQELYDEITDHGRNRLREPVAIQRAIDQQKREEKDVATTRPVQQASRVD